MITKRLQRIFLITIPFYIAHGFEEYFTGFYETDGISKFIFGYFDSMPTRQATFLLFQILFGIFLLTSYLLFAGEKWKPRLMLALGLAFIFETHHVLKAIYIQGYYPGIITGIPLLIVGYYFWKEFLENFTPRDKKRISN